MSTMQPEHHGELSPAEFDAALNQLAFVRADQGEDFDAYVGPVTDAATDVVAAFFSDMIENNPALGTYLQARLSVVRELPVCEVLSALEVTAKQWRQAS